MNWYFRTKFAQIWNVESDETFPGELKRFYELEYKYSMMRDRAFNGMPQRQASMMAKLEAELKEAANNVREPIERTIDTWLSAHALTDPEEWAAQATKVPSSYVDWQEYYEEVYGDPETEGPIGRINNMVDSYMRLNNGNRPWSSGYQSPNWDAAFNKMMLENNAYSFASVQKLAEVLVPEQKEWKLEELRYEGGLQEFNENYGTQYASEEEATAHIESATAEDLGIDILDIMDQGLEHWAPMADNAGLLDGIVAEINQKIVFPVWYGYWGSQGIDQTREDVENISEELKAADTLPKLVAAVSLALNASHQNGEMLEHLESYGGLSDPEEAWSAKEMLDELSNDTFVEQWNKELRAVGVQI